MEIFIDSADPKEIRKWSDIIKGVTTNPSSLGQAIQEWAKAEAKAGMDGAKIAHLSWRQVLENLTAIYDVAKGRPVSVPVHVGESPDRYVPDPDEDDLVHEGECLAMMGEKISPRIGYPVRIVMKLPVTRPGLRACRLLADKGIPCNMTLCFTPAQALMAAEAGAAYISPFVGRLEDVQEGIGLALIEKICKLYQLGGIKHTRVLAASIRSADQLVEVGLRGADIATVPPSVLEEIHQNERTERGQRKFMDDYWKSTIHQFA